MFPGPAQRKQIDKIGQIFSGFLSTCFLGPNPSNIWMFEKWKQHCCQVFFACLFLVRSPQNKPKQLYYVAQFPMTSPPKKNYIYILYILYIIYIYYIYYILYIYRYIVYSVTALANPIFCTMPKKLQLATDGNQIWGYWCHLHCQTISLWRPIFDSEGGNILRYPKYLHTPSLDTSR